MATPLLNLRVDPEAQDRWRAAARDDGAPTLSDWLRSLAEDRIAAKSVEDKINGPLRVGSLDPSLVSTGVSRAPVKKTRKAQVASVCERERFHRPGTFCKSCGATQ